jgi:hypothetical protein
MSTTIFKIRSTVTGLFSAGGTDPVFNRTGKVWKKRGHVICHLGQISSTGRRKYTQNKVEVVEYLLVETPVSTTSYEDWYNTAERNRDNRTVAAAKRRSDWLQEERRRMYEELRKEFGDA